MNDAPHEPVSPRIEPNDPLDTIVAPASAKLGEGAANTARRIGDFSVVRVLGQGGMGTVYLAEDVRLGRKAAIKTMKRELAANPDNRARFLREARAAAAVEHDNIVPVWQVGEAADGSPFIAMPFLQGETLQARLRREPIQPTGMILKVAGEVAEGLAAAHARGLIHRDIKPGNVWMEGDPQSRSLAQQVQRCKILDFGLARSIGTEDTQITASGAVLGTAAYMAPEQARGEKADHRADLFSLGVTLYRMAIGELPFGGPGVMAVLTALATVNPRPARNVNRNLPQALSDLIDRLLCKDPAGRPQSAAEVAAAVRQIMKDADSVGHDEVAPRPTTKQWRGHALLLVALGLLAVVPLGVWLVTVNLRTATLNVTPIMVIEDPDRKAAGWVLSIGGRLRVNDQDPWITAVADLPADAFRLTMVGLQFNTHVSDTGLAHFKGCTNLVDLDLPGTKVSDAGLVYFKDCKNLRGLNLAATHVSGAGLAHFKDCKNLSSIDLNSTPVGDAALAHFKDCTHLEYLGLDSTPVSDAGLAHLKDCENLRSLWLRDTQVSDAGLAYFRKCKNLMSLKLSGKKISDVGLAHFKDCRNLTVVDLAGTDVTDSVLAHFKECKNLAYLDLRKTNVTAAKIEELKKILPRCKIA